jgi:mono/diheme cytochrome c family protein
VLAAVLGALVAERGLAKDATAAKVTFAKDIAPILLKNCAGCHRPGEVGPFSLLSYDDAAKRADFLAEVTSSRRMPPWKAEPNVNKFCDERRLTDKEIELIAAWAADEAPEGDAASLPPTPTFPDGWQLGEPDLLLKMSEPFRVPAGGRDIYRCFVIPIPLDASKMISGVEFRPGNAKVVHHAIMFLDANSAAKQLEGLDGKPGFPSFGGPVIKPTGGLGSWTPGSMPRLLPDGLVKYLAQGSDLVLQVHYHPTGKVETDQSVVGVHFSKKPMMSKIVTGIAVLQTGLKIPAGDAHCEITAESHPLPVNVNVLALTPHMHNLGREFKVVAKLPNNSEVPLVWIKDWDFNWQGAYQFEKPIKLPKGSTINVKATYDNSDANPKNPFKPPKAIRWGEQTTDEMCLCGVQVFADRSSDLKQIAEMRGNELGACLEGGIPGQAEDDRKKAAARKLADKYKAAKEELAKKLAERRQSQLVASAAAPPSEPAAEDEPEEKPPVKSKKAAGKAGSAFPAEGMVLPEASKAFLGQFDLDKDGRLSPEEFNAMPEPMKAMIRQSPLFKSAGDKSGVKPGASPSDEEIPKQSASSEPATKKRAAKSAATEPADDADETVSVDDATEAPKPKARSTARAKTPSRAVSKGGTSYPLAGFLIPEDCRDVFAKYDLNRDGRLARGEYDKMPSAWKALVRRLLAPQPAVAEEESPEAVRPPRPVARKVVAPPVEETAADDAPEAVDESPVKSAPKAAPKAVAKTAAQYPVDGVPIPANLKPLTGNFDLDKDGKISRGEYDKLPDGWKSRFRKLAGLKEVPAAKPPADEAVEEPSDKVSVNKVVAKKTPAQPTEEEMPEEPAEEPVAQSSPAASEPKPEAPAKPAAKPEQPFPSEGIAIPENLRPIMTSFDTNKDGRISKEEFDKVPDYFKGPVRRMAK